MSMPAVDAPSRFTEQKSVEERRRESEGVMIKHPNRIPVILETAASSSKLALKSTKFLVPKDLTMAEFMCVLRKRHLPALPSSNAIFLFINNSIPPATWMFDEIYKSMRNIEDGFLYMTLSEETTFGVRVR
jgi:GABA(A) receptor-associated protein